MAKNLEIVLVCTVGGSPQPILTAIKSLEPSFVEFICTDRDPGTGQPGSCICITGSGNVCKSSIKAEKPDRPSIPVMAGIDKRRFGVTIVPSDDLDIAFWTIRKKLIELNSRYPDAKIMADYTGGTKTMTAALVTAVLETEGISLQIVTGNRPDLFKVKDSTESVLSAGIDSLRHRKAIQPFLSAWKRFAYDEAAEGLSSLPTPSIPHLRSEWSRLKDVSTGFAAWDRFDHLRAKELLRDYAPAAGTFLGPYLGVLGFLTAETEDPKKEPIQMLDLWNNAGRRAIQGRYDDAMARCYRLIEWTAQWLLKEKHGIDAANLSPDIVPKSLGVNPDSEGRLRAGLMKSWELLRSKHDGPAGDFSREHGNGMLHRIKARNSSILAHGKAPIGRHQWQSMKGWMEEAFIPMLLQEMADVGIHKMPPQLPKGAAPFVDSDI